MQNYFTDKAMCAFFVWLILLLPSRSAANKNQVLTQV